MRHLFVFRRPFLMPSEMFFNSVGNDKLPLCALFGALGRILPELGRKP
ncbi:hypothetical protein NEIPOLOT_01449 [Neisseria polysaccharea ATCC 43768]|nr:hypothetical protein NEIPOLOT_01449 [Neisseria polysaccharea ATCC 43768]